MKRLLATTSSIAALSLAISACGSSGLSSNSKDPVLTKAAEQACEEVINSNNNLADFSKWVHNVTGDLNPTYQDSGTVHMELAGQINGTKSFKCQGRVDPQSGMANAVMIGGLQ
jgi:hypothetical protein